MGEKTVTALYRVCEAEHPESAPLYASIHAEEPCMYVKKCYVSNGDEMKNQYALLQTDKSGGSDGYGAAGDNMQTYERSLSVEPERFVCNGDFVIIGYAYEGRYERRDSNGNDRYYHEIFLPVDGDAADTEDVYAFSFYPFDGTSSEYSSKTVTRFVLKETEE